jgi:hypothetical protein
MMNRKEKEKKKKKTFFKGSCSGNSPEHPGSPSKTKALRLT